MPLEPSRGRPGRPLPKHLDRSFYTSLCVAGAVFFAFMLLVQAISAIR